MYREFLENNTPADVAAAYDPDVVVPAFSDEDAQAIRDMYAGSGYEMHFSSRTFEKGVRVASVFGRFGYSSRRAVETGAALPGPVFDVSGRLVPGVGLWTLRLATPDGSPDNLL